MSRGRLAVAFSAFAKRTAEALGTWQAFATAATLVIIWFIFGFHFGFDNQLYQLIINTGTTIVTFLMVFLLQHTQNRDTLAVQLKLDEIVHAMRDASNDMIRIEELSDEELKSLRAQHGEQMASENQDKGTNE